MAINSISIIGTGNLAWHLCSACAASKIRIGHIAGRTLLHAEALANEFGIAGYSEISADLPDADLYIICVKDDAIRDVAKTIYAPGRFIVHNSGATNADILAKDKNRFGAIWPMQTLIKGNTVDYKETMFFVTGSDEETTEELGNFVKKISNRVEFVTDKQRAILHMSAVWVNNFTNHMFDIANTILEENGLKFEFMLPMIKDMMEKASTADPSLLQTGPAKRSDMATIEKHKELLSNHPEWKELYYEISRSIIQKFIKE